MTSRYQSCKRWKVRLATILYPRFRFYRVPAHVSRHSHSARTSHASSLHSTQTEILNFPVNHILQVSCDWILCCDWYTLHSAGQQVTLWPCPRPFPSARNRIWPHETTKPTANAKTVFIYHFSEDHLTSSACAPSCSWPRTSVHVFTASIARTCVLWPVSCPDQGEEP